MKRKNGIAAWAGIGLTCIAIAGSAVLAYGKLSQSVVDHDRRIVRLESVLASDLKSIHEWMDKHP